MTCPNCGAEASGNFCAACGASLRAGKCGNCGAALVPGARFCTKCGRPVGAGQKAAAPGAPGRGGSDLKSNLPWYIGAGVLLVMIGLLLVPMITGREPAPETMGPGPAVAPGTPPPLTGTPREQADRLFNRIMTAQDQGDTTNAKFFAPMGIQAYQAAEPLDADGLFHLALIQTVAGNYSGAREVAERILSSSPNHLLGLAAAAEAADKSGDAAAARSYYQRFLNAYDTESTRDIPEYRDHQRILPEHLAAARRITGG